MRKDVDYRFDASAVDPRALRSEADELEAKARTLRERANATEREMRRIEEEHDRREAEKIPVNREDQVLVSGQPVPEDRSHTELKPNGQQKDYVVLSAAERAKGFVRPFRDSYRHVGMPAPGELRDLTADEHERYDRVGYVKFEAYGEVRQGLGRYWTQAELDRLGGCGQITTMSRAIAETYARDPTFYGGTFCATCGQHFRVGEQGEFVWVEPNGRDGPRVGT